MGDLAVNGLGAGGPDDDRAEVEFGDLRQVVGHLGDPQPHVPQHGEFGGRGAVVARRQRCAG
jgi:hypothetical protein